MNLIINFLLSFQAHKWEPHIDPTGWWVSEKLDGVRAYWDGTYVSFKYLKIKLLSLLFIILNFLFFIISTFLSRVGNVFHAPEWFTKLLPNTPLDGELWCGRSKFSLTVSIAKSVDAGGRWKELTYQVYLYDYLSILLSYIYYLLFSIIVF